MNTYYTFLRPVLCLLLLAATLCFLSCGGLPNMRELLAYQQNGTVFTANVIEGDASVPIKVTLGEQDNLMLAGGMADGVTFTRSDSGIAVRYGDTSLSLADPESARASRWLPLFRLSDGAHWKIRRSRLGGDGVFVCQGDGVTLYLDEATRHPLRIETDGTVIDFSSCEISQNAVSR